MRIINIKRAPSIFGCVIAFDVYMDGICIGKLKNGKSISVRLPDDKKHEIRIVEPYASDERNHGVLYFDSIDEAYDPDIQENMNFIVALNGFNKLSIKGDNLNTETIASSSDDRNQLEDASRRFFDKRILPGPTISAIVLSILLIIFSSMCYFYGENPLYLFILCIVLTIVFCVAMIIDGRYIVVVPLPIIAIWKTYDAKPLQLLKVKRICLTLMILSPALILGLNVIYWYLSA